MYGPTRSDVAFALAVMIIGGILVWEGCKYAVTNIREHVRIEWEGSK